ncbi:MAG: hypothetical protein JXQ73_19480 [Phycisphaerae bacterium]|nr:hypothetical protein [Phycisphaerae bacterium]
MGHVVAQLDPAAPSRHLIFVGSVWPVFWLLVAMASFLAVLWLVIVDGMVRNRFGLGLVLRAVACLWVGIAAGVLAGTGADVGGVGLAVMAVAGVGILVYLYAVERRFVSRPIGLAMTGLRVMLIGVLLAMMAEPVVSLNRTESKRRCLAILADESVSMDVVDRHLTDAERLRLADALGQVTELARPIRLEPEIIQVRSIARRLHALDEWLAELSRSAGDDNPVDAAFRQRRQTMERSYGEMVEAAVRVSEVLGGLLDDRQTVPPDIVGDLVDLKSRLGSQVVGPLTEIARAMGMRLGQGGLSSKDVRRLVQLQEHAGEGMVAIGEMLDRTSWRLDEAFARRADSETRRAMEHVGGLTRREIIARLIGSGAWDLQRTLSEKVDVRSYTFAREPRYVTLGQIVADFGRAPRGDAASSRQREKAVPTTTVASKPTTQGAVSTDRGFPANDVSETGRMVTDLARALERTIEDVPGEELAGVVVLSDGQHNASGDPVRVAESLGALGIAVLPVGIGARRAPTDAAIMKVDVADVVHTEDLMRVSVSVRLDGLKGKLLKIRLLDEKGEPLDLSEEDDQGRIAMSEAPSKEKTISVTDDHERRELRLSHKPKGKGRHVYRVVLDALEEEVFKENNEEVFAVDVTDELTKVLIVDGLPRWEFRYFRNLLLRDESVRLQHVLFDPALIARQPELKQVAARVSNETPEADRLPDEQEELNAFDVIVLGDVSPDDLPRDKQRMIEKFVSDRGGTLILVAGKRHMPLEFEAQSLASLLPVKAAEGANDGSTRAACTESFHLRLTGEGQHHMVTELAAEPETNRSLWRDLPAMHWHSGVCSAKGGASVLAWAEPTGGVVRPSATATTRVGQGDVDPQRDRAMLVSQNYGLGKVLYVAWDATWRFRYKHGDKYHHRLWAQVLRWATAGKLPSGLKLVKIGTDRARYTEGQPVMVRAKFTKADFTPMADAEVRALVTERDQTVSSARLRYVSGSPGVYEASLGGLAAGEYSIRLESPQIADLRQPDDPPGDVATTIVVEASRSAERLELAANVELMRQLAEVSGGAEIAPSALGQLMQYVSTDPIVKHTRRQVTLWDQWWLLAIFGATIGAEWVLRKRAGLM